MAWTGIDAAHYREREEESRDKALTRTGCIWCKWTFTGTAAQAREKARLHREKKHPDAKQPSRRKVPKLGGWRQAKLSEKDQTELEEERRRRMFLLGIE